jgi:peptide/nickel transport system permease protein
MSRGRAESLTTAVELEDSGAVSQNGLTVRRDSRHPAIIRAAYVLSRNWSTRLGAGLVLLFVLVCLIGPVVMEDPLAQGSGILQPPTPGHWFGTDQLGRDLLARAAVGGRISLFVALGSVCLGLLVALPLGMVAGYFAKTWVDDVLARALDIIMALPLFVLAVVFLGLTGSGPTVFHGVEINAAWKVVILIAITTVPSFARVARASTLAEREEDYVDALRVIGVSRFRILFQEILPNVLPPVMVQAFLWMAIAVFAEASLSFLGLGVQTPDPTLGNLLHDARDYILLGAWWYSLFPGVAILIVIVGLNLIGDGLSDLLDPRLRF